MRREEATREPLDGGPVHTTYMVEGDCPYGCTYKKGSQSRGDAESGSSAYAPAAEGRDGSTGTSATRLATGDELTMLETCFEKGKQ